MLRIRGSGIRQCWGSLLREYGRGNLLSRLILTCKMKPSAANAGACALLVSMKLEKVCNGHGLVKGVKSEALGENTGLLYGNEKENRRLAFLSSRV